MIFSFPCVAAAFAVALSLASRGDAIAPITRTGRYLYFADGTRFYIKGIAYQEQGKYYNHWNFV
jgi:1,3-beta-glucanosyltransferase GAS1